MSEKTYLTILRWGVYLTLLIPLLVFQNLLFPFITSKAFYFRILVEILLVIYILFIFQYREYVPKKNFLTIAILIFAAVLILTSFTGVDFNLSFWGDIERMEGAFGFLHLATYFFIIISVFKDKKEWKKLLNVFLFSSIALCFYGLGQKMGIKSFLLSNDSRISATLGNSAYLGAFMLFGMAVASLLLLKTQNKILKIFYFFAVLLQVFILVLTGTRGAYVGLVFGLLAVSILYIFLSPIKKTRYISAGALIFMVVGAVILLSNTNAPVIRNNKYLYRFSHFSFQDATWNTRLISWKAGWQGFQEKPILGVGSGNYAYFFDKYFTPSFYTFTAQQTYFDHAHNTIVDIAVTSGIIGLLSYLAIWVAIIFYLIKSFREENITLNEFLIITFLLAAYFVQNIFVFDCLATFIAFFIIIGYISYEHYWSGAGASITGQYSVHAKFNPVLAVALSVFSLFLIFQFNLKPARAMIESVQGQAQIAYNNDLLSGYAQYKKSLENNTILDRDIRASFINILISDAYTYIKSVPQEKLLQVIDFAISEGEKNLKLNGEDAMMNLQQGQLYDIKANLSKSKLDLAQGEEYLKKALASSPERLQIFFILAQNKLIGGKYKEAIDILEKARGMNPKYSESYVNLSRAYAISGDNDNSFLMMGKAISLGYNNLNKENLDALITYFTQKKDYELLVILYNKSIGLDPKNGKLYAKLAVVYKELGRVEEARTAVEKSVELEPSFRGDAEKFLKTL